MGLVLYNGTFSVFYTPHHKVVQQGLTLVLYNDTFNGLYTPHHKVVQQGLSLVGLSAV